MATRSEFLLPPVSGAVTERVVLRSTVALVSWGAGAKPQLKSPMRPLYLCAKNLWDGNDGDLRLFLDRVPKAGPENRVKGTCVKRKDMV